MRRLLSPCLALLALVGQSALPSAAHAQLGPCVDARPCDPNQLPPRPDPQRHRQEAQTDPALHAEAREQATRAVHAERERAWHARGVVPLPSLVPLRKPVVELVGAMRLHYAGHSETQAAALGPHLAARAHWLNPLWLELGVSVLGQRSLGRGQTALWLEPGAYWGFALGRHGHGRLGGGLLLGSARGGGGADFLLGAKISMGVTARMLTLPHGGYVSVSFDFAGTLHGGWGASDPRLNDVLPGMMLTGGLAVAL